MADKLNTIQTNCNLYFPIFHKPSFIKLVSNGVHLCDKQFGAVVLVVCAIGSRYSHDPRVFSEDAGTEQSSGWKWFSQVRPQRNTFVAPPSLYLVQLLCVSDHFEQVALLMLPRLMSGTYRVHLHQSRAGYS